MLTKEDIIMPGSGPQIVVPYFRELVLIPMTELGPTPQHDCVFRQHCISGFNTRHARWKEPLSYLLTHIFLPIRWVITHSFPRDTTSSLWVPHVKRCYISSSPAFGYRLWYKKLGYGPLHDTILSTLVDIGALALKQVMPGEGTSLLSISLELSPSWCGILSHYNYDLVWSYCDF